MCFIFSRKLFHTIVSFCTRLLPCVIRRVASVSYTLVVFLFLGLTSNATLSSSDNSVPSSLSSSINQIIVTPNQFNQLVKKLSTQNAWFKQNDISNLVTNIELLLIVNKTTVSSSSPEQTNSINSFSPNNFSELERHYLIYKSITKLSVHHEHLEARRLLHKLISFKQKYFTILNDSGRDILVPLFPIASSAKSLLSVWDTKKWEKSAYLAVKNGDASQFVDSLKQLSHAEKFLIKLLQSDFFSNNQLSDAINLLEKQSYPTAFAWLHLKIDNIEDSIKDTENINNTSATTRKLFQYAATLDNRTQSVFFAATLNNPTLFPLGSASIAKHLAPSQALELLFPFFENKTLGGDASYHISQILDEELINTLAQSYKSSHPIAKTRIINAFNNSKHSLALLKAKELISGGESNE